MTAELNKVMRIGTSKTYAGRSYSIYVKATFKNGRLSISGVEGPLASGNAVGGCGQIDMHDWNIVNYAEGWNAAKVNQLRAIWSKWHLNDMKAECEHQESRGENWTTHPSAVCPDCGYKLGSAWTRREVPADVIEALEGFPQADKQPAWV